MKNISVFVIALLFASYIYADTNLPASISKNTTLTKESSPYILTATTTINSGITLTINAGVVLKMPSAATIKVNGTLIAQGAFSDTILFTAIDPNKDWDCILTTNANSEFYYVKTTHAKRFISATAGNKLVISHCNISSSARGYGEDCIAAHDTKRVTIEYITLTGAGGKIANGIKNDAIDLDVIDSCFISFSNVTNFSDDAIDIGTQTKYAEIHDNILSYSNYGITVGETSKAVLYNNLSHNNDGGFQIHTNADVKGYNNTLYNNTVGIEAYHSEDNKEGTGGIIELYNTIFSQNTQNDIITQTNSIVTISYSISDKDSLSGLHNLKEDPKFTDPANGDFSLQASSPCITSGKPDSNGNPTSMGSIVETPVNVLNAYSKNKIGIYPNPATNYIVLCESENKVLKSIAFINILGKEVKRKKDYSSGIQLNINDLPKGIYIVKSTFENGSYSINKLIKR